VETYLNTDTWTFESPQSKESRAQWVPWKLTANLQISTVVFYTAANFHDSA